MTDDQIRERIRGKNEFVYRRQALNLPSRSQDIIDETSFQSLLKQDQFCAKLLIGIQFDPRDQASLLLLVLMAVAFGTRDFMLK